MKNVRFKFTLATGLALLISSNYANAHAGHGDELQWQACSVAEKNDPCEYQNSHGDIYRGNCKLFSEALMCVRNEPIIRAKKEEETTSKVIEDTSYSSTVRRN